MLRDYLDKDTVAGELEKGERTTFRLAARVAFWLAVAMLIIYSATTNLIFAAFVAAGAASLMIRAVMPAGEFQAWARSYANGDAGDRWRARLHGIAEFVRSLSPLSVATALLLVVSMTAAPFGAAGVATAAADGSTACTTTVTHDRYLTNNESITKLQNGSKVTSTKSNTLTTLVKSGGFWKLHAENPNGYCVAFTVLVSKRAMPPAQIVGGVDANDANITATWESVYDFQTGNRYTRIEFTLDPGQTATFAPSGIRVMSLSAATQKPDQARGAWENLTSGWFGNKTELKKTYHINPNTSSSVDVELTHPQTGKPIKEYYAVYSIDGGETWKEVTTDTTAIVYKRELSSDNRVRFYFSEKAVAQNATVRFTANPGISETWRHELDTYTSGIDILKGWFGGSNSSEEGS